MIRRGRLRIPIAAVRDVPLMLGGAARFQRENILAAIAAAYVQGMRYDDIRAGLLSFFPSPSLTPGRLNLMRVGEGRVLVDYAHNAGGDRRTDGVRGHSTRAAHRRHHRAGRPTRRGPAQGRPLCAKLDRVIIREDKYRRGREPGEIATDDRGTTRSRDG